MNPTQIANRLLAPGISQKDREISRRSIEKLCSYITGGERSLVFFVGAGASIAGNTGMPSTAHILHQLLSDALIYSEAFKNDVSQYADITRTSLGFEITLNDLWQICPDAIRMLFLCFAELEEKCRPNCVHAFLACWLASNGNVVTTNYDRMIERQMPDGRATKFLYMERGTDSFESWREDLQHGGCLFKIHGSLDEPESCLGALEHVGTRLVGRRAELLSEIVRTRPLCFVGWRGADPDIPLLLDGARSSRDPSLPTFWIHHEGDFPGIQTLNSCMESIPPLVRPFARENPILTEADRAFALLWSGRTTQTRNTPQEPYIFDSQKVVRLCTKTGVTRMVGIALRRSGNIENSKRVLNHALQLAKTPGEQAAAFQELSLLAFAEGKKGAARKSLRKARKTVAGHPDAGLAFGVLSQTMDALGRRPWLGLLMPKLLRQYRRAIVALHQHSTDTKTLALHTALYYLCQGRLRFKLLRGLGRHFRPLAEWIIDPFETARSAIEGAVDIHLHSRIDVLASSAVCLAYFRRCERAEKELGEIDRLIAILNDAPRKDHWMTQRRDIEYHCGNGRRGSKLL